MHVPRRARLTLYPSHLRSKSRFLPYLVIMLAAFAVVAPQLRWGNASGHDFEFHVNSWLDVVSQWKQGIVYPRWAEWSHYTYGEARFLFYPPASWTLGAIITALVPLKAAPGIYIWIALVLSGCSMFALAQRWLSRRDAIFAAAFYAVNPYYIVIVYWRSAYAELLAGALLPLLLLYLLRLDEDGWKASIPLGLVVAAAWLTNAPSAVMVNYSLALLLLLVARLRWSPRVLLHGAFSIVLGLALAAFYVFPAIYEQHWVDISQVLAPGVRPQDNFLFTTLTDELHNRFNYLVSLVATTEILVVVISAFLSRHWRRQNPKGFWTLIAWASVAILLMTSVTFFLWQHLPKLRFVQLPWRWLLCLNVPLAIFVTKAWRGWAPRLAIYAAMLLVVTFCWHRVQEPWWDNALDMAEMQRNIQEGQGYEGTDEYVPLGADSYEIKQDARRVTSEGPGSAQIHVTKWGAESKEFTSILTQPAKLTLRLFDYPAWKVTINGVAVPTESRAITGQLVIPANVGANRVEVMFIRTWDRTVGAVISFVSVLSLAVLFFISKRRRVRITLTSV